MHLNHRRRDNIVIARTVYNGLQAVGWETHCTARLCTCDELLVLRDTPRSIVPLCAGQPSNQAKRVYCWVPLRLCMIILCESILEKQLGQFEKSFTDQRMALCLISALNPWVHTACGIPPSLVHASVLHPTIRLEFHT